VELTAEKAACPELAARGLTAALKVPVEATVQAESVKAASVMESVALETRLPNASRTSIVGACAKTLPATAVADGCVENARAEALALAIEMASEHAEVSPGLLAPR
jgi:hypothetical protein